MIFVCPFHWRRSDEPLAFKMSALPMCVRVSRGLLSLRSGAGGSLAPTLLELARGLSTQKSPGGDSTTGGLAQAILQEKLQQQQRTQVGQGQLQLTDLSSFSSVIQLQHKCKKNIRGISGCLCLCMDFGPL